MKLSDNSDLINTFNDTNELLGYIYTYYIYYERYPDLLYDTKNKYVKPLYVGLADKIDYNNLHSTCKRMSNNNNYCALIVGPRIYHILLFQNNNTINGIKRMIKLYNEVNKYYLDGIKFIYYNEDLFYDFK